MAVRNIGTYAFIPLPHTGVGIDTDGNPVELTVSGGVSLAYDENGSSHYLDYGCVERNPELYTEANALSINNEANSFSGLNAVGDTLSVSTDSIVGDYSIESTAISDGVKRFQVEDIPLIIGEDYLVSIWAKRGSQGVKQGFYAWEGFSNFNTVLITSTEWIKYTFTLTASSNIGIVKVYSTVAGLAGDSVLADGLSITLATPDYIPNNLQSQPLYPLEEGDTLIHPTSFISSAPLRIRLYEAGDTELAKRFFDKTSEFWKPELQALDTFDSINTGDWNSSELTQQFFYDYIADDYKYMLWSKDYKDIFLYASALTGNDICKAKKYVRLGEEFASAEDATYLCGIDTLTE